MLSRFHHWSISLIAVFLAFQVVSTTLAAPGHVRATLVALDESVQPGQPVTVALKLEHAPRWHTYWLNPGTGYATSLTWTLPDGWRAGEIQWPVPTLIKDAKGNIAGNGYEGTVYLLVTLTPSANLATGGSDSAGDGAGAPVGAQVTFRAKAEWLMCSDVCMPGDADVSLTLPVLATTPKATPLREKVLGAPPMPGKVGDIGWNGGARAIGYTKTIYLSFWPFPAFGPGISDMHFFSSDGFVQYDQPQSVIGAGSAFTTFTLGLPVSDSYDGDRKRLTGVLTYKDAKGIYRGYTIDIPISPGPPPVSQTTPDAGRAVVKPVASLETPKPPQTSPDILGALGERALPSIQNSVSSEMTGSTSENENTHGLEARATSSISAAVLLLAFLGGFILNLMPCVFPVLGIKILGFVNQAGASRRKVTLHGITFTAGVLVLVVLGCWLGWPRASAPTDIAWEKWGPAAVAFAQASGGIVYVDFTARWCATCQANKKLVFGSEEVRRVFREKKILALKADWTNADPQITAELARFNRAAVPFNLIYKPGQPDPIAQPELLTPGVVLDALK